MKLGLLQCDHVDEAFHGIAGDYNDMFARWLPADWRVYDLPAGESPRSLGECDAWVSTGSYLSVYDDVPWIHNFAAVVRALHAERRPFLGVCFGHQMMGHALGGRVAKSPRGWGNGVHEFRVHQTEPWMRPPLESVNLLMSCRDQVEQLPPGAQVLAGDAHCPVGIFRLGTLLGIQGHPEWSREYAEALLLSRHDRIGADLVAQARATLHQPTEASELAAWTSRYFEDLTR